MKVQQIADGLRVTAAYISAIEQGVREPALDKILPYARALRIDPNVLFYVRDMCRMDLPFEILLKNTLEKVIEYDTSNTISATSTFRNKEKRD